MDSVKIAQHVSVDLSLSSEAFNEADIIHLSSDDDNDNIIVISSDDDDELLALNLQFQEVLAVDSASSSLSRNSSQDLMTIIACSICEDIIPATDINPQATCSHALCSVCLHQHVDKILRHNNDKVLCIHEGCSAVLEPELFRDFVPPRLLDRWMAAHTYQTLRADNQMLSKLTRTLLLSFEKKPIEFPDSVNEVGESSSSNQIALSEFYCAICMEEKSTSESFAVGICSHQFCVDCLKSYIAAKVEENVLVVKCPEPDCKEGFLEPEMCRFIVPESVFDRWGLALCESALGAKKFYCPFRECSGLLVIDEDYGAITSAECPHCFRMFCAQCRVPWHDGIDCAGFQQLGEDERGREDIMFRNLASASKWQRCPRCLMFVEKIDGCMLMQCRCGHCFCYVCATEMSKEYHYCAKCRR